MLPLNDENNMLQSGEVKSMKGKNVTVHCHLYTLILPLFMSLFQQMRHLLFMVPNHYKALKCAAHKKLLKDLSNFCWHSNVYAL
jgi:hypothetical protein